MNVDAAPANAGLLRYFRERARKYNYTDLTQPAGTHPDLLSRLWDELGGLLPEDCHAVVYRVPVLLRPSSAVIFAFAGGTHTYAFRLPADVRDAAIESGAKRVYHYRAYPELEIEASTFDLAEISDEWVFGGWLKGEEDWIRAAYDFANNNPAST
jgi:hypothetical protein